MRDGCYVTLCVILLFVYFVRSIPPMRPRGDTLRRLEQMPVRICKHNMKHNEAFHLHHVLKFVLCKMIDRSCSHVCCLHGVLRDEDSGNAVLRCVRAPQNEVLAPLGSTCTT